MVERNMLLVSYVIWSVVAFMVYQNANKRNLKNAFLWGVCILFFGVFGLLAYYLAVIRPNKHA